jgi:hypothetical protein
VEQRPVVQPGDIPGLEPGEAVRADDLKISAGVKDHPLQSRAPNGSAGDRRHAPRALRGFSDRYRLANLDKEIGNVSEGWDHGTSSKSDAMRCV